MDDRVTSILEEMYEKHISSFMERHGYVNVITEPITGRSDISEAYIFQSADYDILRGNAGSFMPHYPWCFPREQVDDFHKMNDSLREDMKEAFGDVLHSESYVYDLFLYYMVMGHRHKPKER